MKVPIWFSFEGKKCPKYTRMCVLGRGGHAGVLPNIFRAMGKTGHRPRPREQTRWTSLCFPVNQTRQEIRDKCPGYAFPRKENKPRGLSLWRQVTEWISLDRVLTIFPHLFQILQKCIVKTENRKAIKWRFKWLSRCKSILGEIALGRIDEIGKQEEN